MLSQVEESKTGWHKKPDRAEVILSGKLNTEQKKALFSITENTESILVISGMAGTGKTTLLKTANEVWEAQGYEVRGMALAGKATQGLEQGSKIKSATIHKTLIDLEKGNIKLSDKTILVVDEAGMVGTRQMATLIDEVSKAKSKLILVGDERQLQPIEHGNPFKAIGDRIGRSELTEIVRQKEEWQRKAVTYFADSEASKGLKAYAERGFITVTEERAEAIKKLVADWSKERGANLEDSLIIAGTRNEVSKLNELAQSERVKKSELGEKGIILNQEMIFEGDRILVTKNNNPLGIRNGDLGTISKVNQATNEIKVHFDKGVYVTIPTRSYKDIQLGYAVTVHKSQGESVNKIYALVGGWMQDRELSYVQMSRAREQTKIYTERVEVGNTIAELSKQMSRSRQKEIAQDFIEQEVKNEREIKL